MSWWDTGNGDDVIGDQPADVVRQTLAELSGDAADSKPTLKDLLSALAAVTGGSAAAELVEDPGPHEIAATTKSGEIVPGSRAGAPRRLIEPLSEGVRHIRDQYQERWERKPRVSELLDAFAFVLRFQPEDYVSDGREHPPASIKAT